MFATLARAVFPVRLNGLVGGSWLPTVSIKPDHQTSYV
ncbi:hypothetical protein L841_2242 [Mycobacterium sp. MAC_080597_8934]|nr:hypothetical protein L839_1109 [Mycobacterium avium MAV_120809_2495]ETZ51379.1 hypothetical protein L839_1102 [Mycobacterium avium MAV_120809_2495]ETZ56232.1 hypothetical protein L840_3991 [Mycobacterium sp. MAC_011194_8550]ETZ56729.1 hypothetical protein L839_0076 [Mycobacterium avium MAV_120809_2495]ETZ68119.1 hypothetical protein L841_2242 [Mycobacterium sp. MAC_080597_8934]